MNIKHETDVSGLFSFPEPYKSKYLDLFAADVMYNDNRDYFLLDILSPSDMWTGSKTE